MIDVSQLQKGDHVLVSKSAWSEMVIQPDGDLACEVMYFNDLPQVMVTPLDKTSKVQAKYVFRADILRKLN